MSLEKMKAYLKQEIMKAAKANLFGNGEMTLEDCQERFAAINRANESASLEELVQRHMEAEEACHIAHDNELNIKGALMFRSAGFSREEVKNIYLELEEIAVTQLRKREELKERVGNGPRNQG
jgi:hypothetical protein